MIKEEEAQDMESKIKSAMRARVADFREQADSLTLEGVRRALEKDMGLEELTLDAHKKFIKQILTECFSELDDDNAAKNSGKNSEEVVTPKKEEVITTGEEEPEPNAEGMKPHTEDVVKKEDSPILMDSQMAEHGTEENKGGESEKVLSEETIKKAIKKRASYLRANSETITFARARRLLEEDLKLEKNSLDAYKSFISEQLDEVMQSAEVESKDGLKKKSQKKATDSKAVGGSSKGAHRANSGDGGSDSGVSSGGEKELIKPKKKAVKKVAARKTEEPKKRKRSPEEIKPSSNGKSKPVKSAKGNDANEDGNSSGDGKSQSSAEEAPKKKRETSTPVYAKRVEHLKSIIKACGMSVPPSVYKKAKQAPENKREAHLIKELEEILKKEGLSSNPSEKEIKEVKKKKERAKELEGIDMSNIVSSTRRRSTSSFLLPPPPPPKAKLVVEKEKKESNDDNGGGGNDEDEDNEENSDDEESESASEGASEEAEAEAEDESD